MDENMKLRQLSVGEWKQGGVQNFGLIGSAEANTIAVLSMKDELTLLELSHNDGLDNNFPFNYSNIAVPKSRPCAALLKQINLSRVYLDCDVQESQELGLEPMYVAEFSLFGESPEARIVQMDWAPRRPEGQPVLTLLTSHGALQLWGKKQRDCRRWQVLLNDVSMRLFSEVFPLETSPAEIETFAELKQLVGTYWITAFAWADTGRLLYAATAVGQIVALSFADDDVKLSGDMRESDRHQTEMGRITYLQAFGEFLLVGNVDGCLHLLTVTPKLREVTRLWSRADRMAIRKACVTYVASWRGYLVVTAKAAHVLAYRLDDGGKLLDTATLFLGGVQISALETLCADELLAASITGVVQRLRVSGGGDDKQKLRIEAQIIDSDVDAANQQIVGMTSSPNRALWSLLLHRNKEYARQSKYTNQAVSISVCALSSVDPLAQLSATRGAFDSHLDCLVAVRLAIGNAGVHADHPFADFGNLESLDWSAVISGADGNTAALLRQLQLRLHIVRCLARTQQSKLGSMKQQARFELTFLEHAIQLVHLLDRLAATTAISGLPQAAKRKRNQLGGAPDGSEARLRAAYQHVSADLQPLLMADQTNPLHDSVEEFARAIAIRWSSLAPSTPVEATDKHSEPCRYCEGVVDDAANWTKCSDGGHPVPRCCVTYQPVQLSTNRHCAECDTYALDDDTALQAVLAPDQPICCMRCRFTFICDDYRLVKGKVSETV